MAAVSIIVIACLLAMGRDAHAAKPLRAMEDLDRGVVAVKVEKGVFVGWRLLGTDPRGIGFRVYRDGEAIEAAPAAGATNLVDPTGTVNSRYEVRPVVNGVEKPAGGAAAVWASPTLRIPLERPDGGVLEGKPFTYAPSDVAVGDLDGDGQWELVVKWDPSNSKDNSHDGRTGTVSLDAYELSGHRLWRIDLGRNIRAGAHYTQVLVGDYDSDGHAEVACKTAPGTRDGAGSFLEKGPAKGDDDAADFVDTRGRILDGPEYLTLFDGRSGKELDTVDFWPPRGRVADWGDAHGNRVDRFLATNAYLDGRKPSMVFQRGYYTRMALAAYDWNGRNLTRRWTHDSATKGQGGHGQGNHNLAAADVDGDGRDEIVEGSCVIDDDGTLLSRTGLGHGDAMHVGDLDPDNKGLEVWCMHEEKKAAYGQELHDARTGRILWGTKTGNDVGRGLAADVDGGSRGHEMWSTSVEGLWSCTGERLADRRPRVNFRVYWDGDLEDELLDGVRLDKWTANGLSRLVTLPGTACNGSKQTPNFSGDLLGDWREEVITHDDESLFLTTTTIPSKFGVPTLAHDPVYRLAMSWQNAGYNQPPHLGFWLGAGADSVPRPAIRLVQRPAAGTAAASTHDLTAERPARRLEQRYDVGDAAVVRVTVELGGDDADSVTSIKAEDRRLMALAEKVPEGGTEAVTFNVAVRRPEIVGPDGRPTARVGLKPREEGSRSWDDALSLEFLGDQPRVRRVTITPALREDVTMVFLAGDSTVTDQSQEPYAGWGQMLPLFFGPQACVANHAESGLTLASFRGSRRLDKILSEVRPGDFVLVQFGHNDQKDKREGEGPFAGYSDRLRSFVKAIRDRGGKPVLVTSVARRRFDEAGSVVESLGDFPEAVRRVAAELAVPLVDLNDASKRLYAALGVDGSRAALVHHPAGTFPGQDKPLKDDSHFSNYGAHQMARCVVESIRTGIPDLAALLRRGVQPFDPALPDRPDDVAIPPSPVQPLAVPEGR